MLIIKSTHPRLPKQKMQLIPFYIPSQLFHPYRCGCNTIPNTSSACCSWKQLSRLSSETQKMQLVTFYISPWSIAQLPCQTKLFFAPPIFFPLNPPTITYFQHHCDCTSITSFLSHTSSPHASQQSLCLTPPWQRQHYAVPEWAQGGNRGLHMMPSPSSPSRRSSRLWYGRRKRRMAK